MPIKAIIFDIDNTLLDWSGRKLNWFKDPDGHLMHLHRAARFFAPTVSSAQLQALDEAFALIHRALISEDLEEAPHLGRMLVKALAEVGITPPSPEAALSAYDWRSTPDVKPFPDVAEGLAQLQAEGYLLGIITNGYQPMAMRDLELAAHGLLGYLSDCRFSSADVGVLKPDPRIFQAALDCLNLPAEETVYVGDHLFMDVLGAQQIGMKGVLRTTEDATTSSLAWITPDASILSLHELLPFLAEW